MASSHPRPHVARNYPEYDFGGFTDVDGTIRFYTRVNALLKPDSTVLDIGCGRGAYGDDPVGFRRQLRILKGKVARVIGLDPDSDAACNPFLDEFRKLDGPRWPLDDASVDVVVADCVVEHVEDPAAFFAEVARVLRPGGHVCIRTTNRLSYIGIASALVPNALHARVLGRVQAGREERDVFPTVYRCNTARKLRSTMRAAGFSAVVYAVDPEPGYLQFSALGYKLGVLHQRLAPRALGPVLFAFGRLGG